MELVNQGQIFSFNYTAYDQNPTLYVAFSLYDVTSGTAVFVTKVTGAYSAFGGYTGTYSPSYGKTYLIIGVVYTDNTYTVPDSFRPPSASVFQTVQGNQVTKLGYAYSSYDQNAGLFVQGTIYDLSTGSPVFVQNTVMTLVAFGVYYASYTGLLGNTYQAMGVVYTDGTYSSVDSSRAPSSDEFDCISVISYNFYNSHLQATLAGQDLVAVMTGQSVVATLTET